MNPLNLLIYKVQSMNPLNSPIHVTLPSYPEMYASRASPPLRLTWS